MENIFKYLSDFDLALYCSDHRYGCGFTAALLPRSIGEDLFGALTDDSGSCPFILQPFLVEAFVPVPVAAGRSPQDAIDALERKLNCMGAERVAYGLNILYDLHDEMQEHGEWSLRYLTDLHAEPWYHQLVEKYKGCMVEEYLQDPQPAPLISYSVRWTQR